MAGISIIKTKDGLLNKKARINEILNSLNYLNSYSSNTYFLADNIFIGWNKYNEYPVKTFENETHQFTIEGRIYNKSESIIENELRNLFNKFSEQLLKDWLFSLDGDFIIAVYDKKRKKLFAFNDLLARIPIYYKINKNEILISRYFRFITELVDNTSDAEIFDNVGFGEFMLFGFLLGERTLFRNIKQMKPATLITADDSGVSVKIINNFDFENREHKNKNFKEIIVDLSNLLSQSCFDRCNNKNLNLIALSGGMDSRTIAACMAKNKIQFKAVTMISKSEIEKEEVKTAQQISSFLNAEWNLIKLTPPVGHDINTLLNLKEGMNYLATAFLLPFYNEVNRMYGSNINLITGDKGDKATLTIDNPINKCSNQNELVHFITGEHSMGLNIDEVCSIVNVKKEDILHDLNDLLSSYPEKDLSQKYIHFRVIEKSHKLAFQGEDRHRKFFWTYCPLTSTPFVVYLFNCPDRIKKMHKLFTALLKSFSTEIANTPYTDFKAPITSLRGKLFMAGVYYVYPKISYKLRGNIKNFFFGLNPLLDEKNIFYKCINEQLNNTEQIHKYLKIENASQLNKYRNIILQSVFTLTSLVDGIYSNKSILNNYSNQVFDQME